MLIDVLKKDLLVARKSRDKFTSGVLGTLVSEAVMIGKDMGNRETTDQEVLKLIQKFKKGAVENTKLLGCSFREITKTKEENVEKCLELGMEINIYDAYLPTQLTEAEIVKEIGILIGKDPSYANIGRLMAHFRKTFDGQYDGKELAKIINEVIKD